VDDEDKRQDPDYSIIQVLTRVQYDCLTVQEIQEILQHQHIVVTGYDSKTFKFDEEGLSTLGGLNIQQSLHGKSSIFVCLVHKYEYQFRPVCGTN
jgi:hypothetical protein